MDEGIIDTKYHDMPLPVTAAVLAPSSLLRSEHPRIIQRAGEQVDFITLVGLPVERRAALRTEKPRPVGVAPVAAGGAIRRRRPGRQLESIPADGDVRRLERPTGVATAETVAMAASNDWSGRGVPHRAAMTPPHQPNGPACRLGFSRFPGLDRRLRQRNALPVSAASNQHNQTRRQTQARAHRHLLFNKAAQADHPSNLVPITPRPQRPPKHRPRACLRQAPLPQ